MSKQFNGFVALGDSFTEGMNDIGDDGKYRGWADLAAGRLVTSVNPKMTYANLAVRGRLFDSVVDNQVPAALRLRPDLVSFCAGGNDALRPNFNPTKIATRLHETVRVLTASDATVVLLTSSSVDSRLPATGLLHNRFVALNTLIRKVAKRHNATLVDLWSDPQFKDRRLWSEDRLHMSQYGHKRVARHVCEALDVEPDPAWSAELPPIEESNWFTQRREDMDWARTYLAPWVRRRLAGKSSGDKVKAKRPNLSPVRNEGS